MTGRRHSIRLADKEHRSEIYLASEKTRDGTAYGSFTDDSLPEPCKYKYRGCKRRLSRLDLKRHESECSFRWYECEGHNFAHWDCEWKGYYEDVHYHFKHVHPERTYMRVQNVIETTLVYTDDSYDIQLIKKSNKLFWFKHRVLSDNKAAYWLCQYVGPQDEAVTYRYELILRHELRKFAITELCFTDALDANEIYRLGKCAIVTFDQLKSFASEAGQLRLYFRIKKNVKR